jgi:hypothetical protein
MAGIEVCTTRIRFIVDYEGLVADPDGRLYHDADVVKTVKDARRDGDTLWVIDLKTGVLPDEESRSSLGERITLGVLSRSWPQIPLEAMLDGYWVSANLYALRDGDARSVPESLDLEGERYVRVQTTSCYLRPSGVDPYCEIWDDYNLVAVSEIPPRRYGDQTLVFVHELSVREDSGRILRGYSKDVFLAREPIGTTVTLSLDLVECSRISSGPLALPAGMEKDATSGPFAHVVRGKVVGLWWLGESMYSVDVGGRIVTVHDSRHIVGRGRAPKYGDWVEAVGDLQISQRFALPKSRE